MLNNNSFSYSIRLASPRLTLRLTVFADFLQTALQNAREHQVRNVRKIHRDQLVENFLTLLRIIEKSANRVCRGERGGSVQELFQFLLDKQEAKRTEQ